MATIRPTSSSSVKVQLPLSSASFNVHFLRRHLYMEDWSLCLLKVALPMLVLYMIYVFIVPHFTASCSTEQLNDNPVTYAIKPPDHDIASEEKTKCSSTSETQLNTGDLSAVVSNGNAVPQQSGVSEESLSESDDDVVPSVTDVLTDAGVILNLNELLPTQNGQAPLELVTEVRILVLCVRG